MCSKLLFAPPTHNIINNIMNQTIVQFYPDATKSLIALTNALLISAAARTKKPFYLALSGGETARSLFEIWKNQYNDPKRWKNVHFFWVDERCVSSENEESNYHWAERGGDIAEGWTWVGSSIRTTFTEYKEKIFPTEKLKDTPDWSQKCCPTVTEYHNSTVPCSASAKTSTSHLYSITIPIY